VLEICTQGSVRGAPGNGRPYRDPAAYRGQGVARALLRAAVAYARQQGATLVEAYPVDKPARSADDTMWFGAKVMYDKAGFKEVARRKPHRPIVRVKLA